MAKYPPAKKGAASYTPEESQLAMERLKEKYPQMFRPGWSVAQTIRKKRAEGATGSRQMREGIANLSEGDYDELRKRFGKKK